VSNFNRKQISLTDDKARKQAARVAIMTRRLELGIIDQDCTRPYLVSATGTPEEVAAVRREWGIT